MCKPQVSVFALDLIGEIRAIAQPELGWDDAKWEAEVASYTTTWKKAYAP